MQEIEISTYSIPSQARNKNYQAGVSVKSVGGSSNSSSVDLSSFLDKSTTIDQTIVGLITFLKGLKLGGTTITYDETQQAIKVDGNLYTTGGFSALGMGQSGSGSGTLDEALMWSILANAGTEQIAVNHLSDALAVYAKTTDLSSYVTNSLFNSTLSAYAKTANLNISHWDSAFETSHTHSNKAILDGITSVLVGNWNTAYTNNHNHSNKTVLDNLTQSVIDNSHTHGNKSVLDSITTDLVTEWNLAYTNNHTHGNKTLLDSITSDLVTEWNLAYTNNHTHSNKSVLDGITSTLIANWNAAYGWGNHAQAGYLKQSVFDDLFEKVNVGTTENPVYAIKAKYDFYSVGGISALGVGSSGSGGGGIVNTVYTSVYLSNGTSFVDTDTDKTFNAFSIKSIYDEVQNLKAGTLSSVDWNIILNKPTTVLGYGITDAYTSSQINNLLGNYSLKTHTHSFSDLLNKPTTLSGYGITDALSQSAAANTYFPLSGGTISGNIKTPQNFMLTPSPSDLFATGRPWYGISLWKDEQTTYEYLHLGGYFGINLETAYTATVNGHNILDDSNFTSYTNTLSQFTNLNSAVTTLQTYFTNGVANNANNSDKLDGLESTDFFRAYGTLYDFSIYDSDLGQSVATVDGNPSNYDNLVSYSWNQTFLNLGNQFIRRKQLIFTWDSDTIYYRRHTDSDWLAPRILAFLDSNVASATKLQTARSIWGQSFDGTADVTGSLSNVTTLVTSGLATLGGGILTSSILCTGTETVNGLLTASGNIYVPSYIQIGSAKLIWDSGNSAVKVVGADGTTAASLYTTGGLSALGLSGNGSGGSGLISTVYGYGHVTDTTFNNDNLTDTFNAYTIHTLAGRIASSEANIANLLAGSALSLTVSGTGNAVTDISKSGTAITVSKNSTFSFAGHTHDFSALTNKPTTLSGYGITDALGVSNYSSYINSTYIQNILGSSVYDAYGAAAAIQVGGRNFYLRSTTWTYYKGWANHGVTTDADGYIHIHASDGWAVYSILSRITSSQATVSYDIKASNITGQKAYLFFNFQNTPSFVDNDGDALGTEWEHHSFTAPANTYLSMNVGVSVEGMGYSADITIRNLNIEEGNKETSWTPAPEDVEADYISRIADEATARTSAFNTLNSYFTNGVANSAAKLSNSRFIWGHYFDGSGDINGDLSSVGNIITNSSNANIYYKMNTDSYAWWLGVGILSGDDKFVVYDATAQQHRFCIDKMGRVGINTTTPAYLLDVNGATNITGLLTANAGIAASTGLFSGNIITTLGKVGIGNSSPAYTLDVSGQIHSTGGLYVGGPASISGMLACSSSLTAQGLVLPYSGGSWISMATTQNALTCYNQQSDSLASVLARIKDSSGNAFCLGGLGGNVGFYGYSAENISNVSNFYNWSTIWNVANGNIFHSAGLTVGNSTQGLIISNGSQSVQITVDSNGNLKINGNLLATGGVTALQTS